MTGLRAGGVLSALLVDAAECGARVLEAELQQELCGFELVPGVLPGASPSMMVTTLRTMRLPP